MNNLLELPLDVLIKILGLVSKTEILQLVLVCKMLNHNVMECLKLNCFPKRDDSIVAIVFRYLIYGIYDEDEYERSYSSVEIAFQKTSITHSLFSSKFLCKGEVFFRLQKCSLLLVYYLDCFFKQRFYWPNEIEQKYRSLSMSQDFCLFDEMKYKFWIDHTIPNHKTIENILIKINIL